jgi:hypothetical protein
MDVKIIAGTYSGFGLITDLQKLVNQEHIQIISSSNQMPSPNQATSNNMQGED